MRPFSIVNPLQQYLSTRTRDERRQYFKEFERQRLKWPEYMAPVPLPADLPEGQQQIKGQWRSRYFLATLWDRGTHMHLTIHRTEMAKDGTWMPGITWEDMQVIKIQCGLGKYVGQVLFPNDDKPAAENTYVMYLREQPNETT